MDYRKVNKIRTALALSSDKQFETKISHIEDSGAIWERMNWLVKCLKFREFGYGFAIRRIEVV